MNNTIRLKVNDKITYPELNYFFYQLSPSVQKLFYWDKRTGQLDEISLMNSVFVTARLEGELVGFIKIITDKAYEYYFSEVIVLPELRGKHIGTKMIKAGIEYCKAKGFIQIFLTAAKGKESYYRKFGFKPTQHQVMKIEKT